MGFEPMEGTVSTEAHITVNVSVVRQCTEPAIWPEIEEFCSNNHTRFEMYDDSS